ncbi:hypothetical protein PM082_016801 [Marasmius tenuissimus]|nr:hypothetical protein PM082_016801 [Marasmius tenuissimus]
MVGGSRNVRVTPCVTKSSPVAIIVEGIQRKMSTMAEKIYALRECKADHTKPIVTDIIS